VVFERWKEDKASNKKGLSAILPKSLIFEVPRPRVELGTRGFSVRCSTD
jgi:hypothetical protein